MATEHEHKKHKEKHFFFVDGDKHETHEEHVTGALIRSKLPETKRGYALFEEGHHHEPEKEIHDTTHITLEKGKPKRFCSIHKTKEKYFYFVDSIKYESDEEHTTGALIKSKLPEAKRGYALFEEGQGDDPDKQILDSTSITLDRHKHKKFYTVPSATAGIA